MHKALASASPIVAIGAAYQILVMHATPVALIGFLVLAVVAIVGSTSTPEG